MNENAVEKITPLDWLGIAGSRIVVAGAGGFGWSLIEQLLQQGVRVLAVDRSPERLDEVASIEGFASSGSGTFEADLTAPHSGEEIAKAAISTLGGIDAGVHLIGVNDRRPLLDFSDEEWSRIIDVNLSTAFRFGQGIGRHLVAQGSGTLVFASSVSGLLAHPHHGPYAASKGGINQLARVMASEWAASGVTVNAVAPGYSETHLTREHLARPGMRERLVSLVPMGRLSSSEEVASAITFLLSPRAAYITGHVLYIDGGRTLV